MDYYEELGLTPAAHEEEIRRSHRRLAKLFHPDQQTDEAMKHLAETQMRRLNSMVATLMDPEKREAYDEQLRGELPILSLARTKRTAKRSWLWWLASATAAIVLTIMAQFLWTRGGKGKPTDVPAATPEIASEPKVAEGRQDLAAAVQPARAIDPPLKESRTLARVSSAPVRKKLNVPASMMVARAQVRATKVELPPPPKIALETETNSMENTSLPIAPRPAPEPLKTVVTHASARPKDPLEGEWVYAPTVAEKKKSGFYPPEFIDMKLVWSEGGLRGQYRARYTVADNKSIPPEVEFTLAPDRDSRHFLWQSSTGSEGTLRIKSIEAGASSMRIEWQTTKYSPGLHLTAGSAVLVRRPAAVP